MAKRTFSAAFSIADTAAWRQRVSEISNALTAVGLIKSSDTGQINPETTTLPSAGTDAGYEIRFLNDSLHATAPVYLRIDYGRTTASNGMRISVTMGLSTNGAGTITGLNTGVINTSWAATVTASGAIPSYFAAGEGYAWMAYMLGFANSAATMSAFGIFRTVDAAGEITADAVALYYTWSGESSPGFRRRVISRAASNVFAEDRAYSMVVGNLASTETASGPQVYRHWAHTPVASRLRHLVTYRDPEISAGAVVSLPVVGEALDYLAIGPQIPKCSVQEVSQHCVALAWTGATV